MQDNGINHITPELTQDLEWLERKRWAEDHFRGCELNEDYYNALAALWVMLDWKIEDGWAKLQPIKAYWEYFKEQYSVRYADLMLQLSNPDTVKAIDGIIQEFNADLERIKRERDEAALRKFLDQIKNLLGIRKS